MVLERLKNCLKSQTNTMVEDGDMNKERHDNILLILNELHKVSTATKLEKLCYFLDEDTEITDYDNEDYNWKWKSYGWTSIEFYDDLLFLLNIGLVKKKDMTKKSNNDIYAVREVMPYAQDITSSIFYLTNKGKKAVEKLPKFNLDRVHKEKRSSLTLILEKVYDEYKPNTVCKK